jgi:hypothetical protein
MKNKVKKSVSKTTPASVQGGQGHTVTSTVQSSKWHTPSRPTKKIKFPAK